MTVLLLPSETWFSTQIKLETASVKMVPPWNLRSRDSLPKPDGKRPGVLQMYWSVETNCPTSSLFRNKAPYFSGNGWTLFTLVGLFLALANMQDS